MTRTRSRRSGVAVDARRTMTRRSSRRQVGEADASQARRDEIGDAHGRSFSTGTTRMPLAPAAAEAGQDGVDLVGGDHRVHGDHVLVREGDDRGGVEPGQDLLDGLERGARRVHHEVLDAASRDDRLEHRDQLRGEVRPAGVGRAGSDEDGLARTAAPRPSAARS